MHVYKVGTPAVKLLLPSPNVDWLWQQYLAMIDYYEDELAAKDERIEKLKERVGGEGVAIAGL